VGITFGGDIDPGTANQYNLPVDHGVFVREVSPGGPAAAGGLQAGDIIVAVDGKRISNWNEFIRELFSKRPGDRVRIEYFRESKRGTAEVTLGQRP